MECDIPLILVFAFFGGVGIELVGEELEGEGYVVGGGGGTELVESWVRC